MTFRLPSERVMKMKIVTGPIAMALPGWCLEGPGVTGIVAGDGSGRPEVLTAQLIAGAAVSGVRTLLLPVDRENDPVWMHLVQLLAGGDRKAAGQALRHLPMAVHTAGTGMDKLAGAGLVYAPAVTGRELRQMKEKTQAPVLVPSEDGANEVIRVCGDTVSLDSIGCEIPVMLDLGGLMYRAA